MLKFGSNNIGKVFFGSNLIGKAYYGSNLVYSAGSSPTPPGPLPTGYTQVDYVENSPNNSAYIKTGIMISNNLGYEIEAYTYDLLSTAGYGCIFGGRVSSGNNDFQISTYTTNAGVWHGIIRTGGSTNYDPGITRKAWFTASLRNGVITNGVGKQITPTINITSGNSREVYLFALNNDNSVVQNGHLRIRSLKFYDDSNGTMIRNFIPCKNPSNIAGLYDTVNGVFYSSANSTNLVASE